MRKHLLALCGWEKNIYSPCVDERKIYSPYVDERKHLLTLCRWEKTFTRPVWMREKYLLALCGWEKNIYSPCVDERKHWLTLCWWKKSEKECRKLAVFSSTPLFHFHVNFPIVCLLVLLLIHIYFLSIRLHFVPSLPCKFNCSSSSRFLLLLYIFGFRRLLWIVRDL